MCRSIGEPDFDYCKDNTSLHSQYSGQYNAKLNTKAAGAAHKLKSCSRIRF